MKYSEIIVLEGIPFNVEGKYEEYNREFNRFYLDIDIEKVTCDTVNFTNIIDYWKIQVGTVNITLNEMLLEKLREAIPETIRRNG